MFDDIPTGDESMIVILQPSTLSSEILDPRNDATELGVLKTDVEEGIWCNATSPETPPAFRFRLVSGKILTPLCLLSLRPCPKVLANPRC